MGTSSTRRALIVGGGIAGMSTAITLGKIGMAVDLIDLDPHWRVYGAGISITGPTLRAFGALGILDAVRREGFTGDGIQVCDAQGAPSHVVPTPIVADGDVPGSGGIMRPVLHRILSEKTLASGAQVRLGLTVDRLDPDSDGVTACLSDGTSGRYDLVVGADGVFSKVRRLLFPEAPGPVYTGQCVWRVTVPRPPEVVRRMFFLGGPVKVGLTPVSRDEMYMFLLETGPKRPALPDDQLPGELKRLLAGYGGVLRDVREGLNPSSHVVLRPLEGFLLPRTPAEKARVLLSAYGAWFEGHRLAGVAALETDAYKKEHLAEVVGLYTIERFKGEGVGVRILASLTDVAVERGCRAMFACTSNVRAGQFFERSGFVRVEPSEIPQQKWKGRRKPLPECFWFDL